MKRHITISVTIAIHMGEMVWAKTPQRFEHLVPDYCKEREGYVMIGLLLGISHTKHQLKTIQKIEHNLAYMDYAMIFCL